MTTVGSIGVSPGMGIAGRDLSGMDPMLLLQLVLSEKAGLQTDGLTSEVKLMQDDNKRMSELNKAQAKLVALKQEFPADAKDDQKIWDNGTDYGTKYDQNLTADNQKAMAAAGYDTLTTQGADAISGLTGESKQYVNDLIETGEAMVESGVMTKDEFAKFMGGDFSKGDIETKLAEIKAMQDDLQSAGSLKQIALQQKIQQKDATENMLSTTVKKHGDLLQGIISKF